MSGVKAWKERSRAGGRGEPVHLTKPEVFPEQGGALAKGDDRGVRSKKTHVLLCPGQDIPQKRGTLTQEAEVMSLVTLAIIKVLPEGSLHGEALSVHGPALCLSLLGRSMRIFVLSSMHALLHMNPQEQ